MAQHDNSLDKFPSPLEGEGEGGGYDDVPFGDITEPCWCCGAPTDHIDLERRRINAGAKGRSILMLFWRQCRECGNTAPACASEIGANQAWNLLAGLSDGDRYRIPVRNAPPASANLSHGDGYTVRKVDASDPPPVLDRTEPKEPSPPSSGEREG